MTCVNDNTKAQAITTRYLKPTNTRGTRIKAINAAGIHSTVAYDYALSEDLNHAAAARTLAESLAWTGRWIGAGLNSRGDVFVCLPASVDCVGFAFVVEG